MSKSAFRRARATFPTVVRGAVHALPYLALAAAALLIVRLAVQVRDLRQGVADLRRDAALPHAGLVVPTFTARTLEGQPATVGRAPGGGRQVLFVFNTTCGFCRQTIPRWNAIVRQLRSTAGGVAVYGISSDPDSLTRPYVLETGIEFPVVTFPDDKLVGLYHARGVPATLVVDSAGTVLYTHLGEFQTRPDVADSVLAAAGAPLDQPSTSSPPPAAQRAGTPTNLQSQGRIP